MNSYHKFILLTVGLCAFAATASAQSSTVHEIGSFEASTSLDLLRNYTDNFFYQEQGAITARGFSAKPTVTLTRDDEITTLTLRGVGEYSKYDLPPGFEDNYLDWDGAGNFRWTAGTRNRVDFAADYRHGHDPLGTVRTQGSQTETRVDQWNNTSGEIKYRFGAPEAAINIEAAGNIHDRQYTTNENATQFLNYTTVGGGSTLFYNYSPKTAALVDVEYKDVNFDMDNPAVGFFNRDFRELVYRAGIRWKASAKTTGDLRAGYSTQNYKRGGNAQRANWRGSIIWAPAARTTFTLITARSTQETYLNTARSIDNLDVAGEWAQRWGDRLTTFFQARYVASDFTGSTNGSGGSERQDSVINLSLSAEYRLLRYFSILGNAGRSRRSSNVAGLNFEVTSAYVGLRLTP